MNGCVRKKPSANLRRALVLFRHLKRYGLGDHQFKGLTEQQVLRAIKRTRQAIWQEKVAARA